MIGFAIAGLFAHTMFLWTHARAGAVNGSPLSNWRDWCLIMAWFMAFAYLTIAIRRPRSPAGLFMLPVVLALIGLAMFYGGEPFPEEQTLFRLSLLHGVSLMLGAVMVMLGFVAGVLYLAQSYRLKHKPRLRQGFLLPSLEWLQRVNRQSLFFSSVFIAVGFAAGILLNLVKGSFPWTDLVVLTSSVLLLWLALALLSEYFYKPARQGRKIAYMTVASFLFLVFALASCCTRSMWRRAARGPDRRRLAPHKAGGSAGRATGLAADGSTCRAGPRRLAAQGPPRGPFPLRGAHHEAAGRRL